MTAKSILLGVHRRLLSISKILSNVFVEESIKRGGYVCKIAYKAIIIVAETKKH